MLREWYLQSPNTISCDPSIFFNFFFILVLNTAFQNSIFPSIFSYLQSPHHMNGSSDSQADPAPPAPYLGLLAVLTGAAAVIFAFVYIRNIRRPF